MKKCLPYLKLFSVVLAMLVITVASQAAVRTASATGNWNNVATWGGASFPVAGDDVFINPGVTVTVNIAGAACSSITFTAGATGSTLTISGTNSLTVSGAITMNGTTATSGTQTTLINVGGGSLSCASIALNPIVANLNSTNRRVEVTVSTGSITVSGSISASGDIVTAGGDTGINCTSTGTINIGDSFYTSPNFGLFTESTGTVNYNGAAQTILAHTYNNLTISGTNTKTLSGATTVATTLSLAGGTLAAGTNLTMGAGGIPTITRSGGDMTGTPQSGNDYNVTYTGSDKTTGTELAGTGLASITVTLNTGDTLTLDANRSPDANLTLNEGMFDLSTFTINRTTAGGTLTIGDGAILKIGGTNTFPSNYNTHTVGNVDATVEYGGAAQNIAALTGAEVYTNLTLSGTGIKTFPNPAETVNGILSIQGAATTAGTSPGYGGSAILEYAGSVAQNTSNVEFPTTVNVDLVINNASGVSLNGQKTLSGSLTLTSGVLTTSSTNLLIFPDTYATVNGGSGSSYVDGPVRKVGDDAFTFPVGRAGVYAPISISVRNNNGDIFQVEYNRESATALGPINAAISSSIYRVSNCEYWDIDEIANAGAANNINITARWSVGSGCGPLDYISNFAAIRLVHFDDVTTNTWNLFGGTPTGDNDNGTVTWNAVTVFSPFALGSAVDDGNPLPVKFTDVKAFEKGNGVQIEWTNQTEENLVNYIVERSSNAVDFTVVSTVAPRSNMSDKQSYTSFDAIPAAGANFYRIKAVELDGKLVYSKMLKVEIGKNPKGILLYPNPVTGKEVSIGFSAAKGQYTLRVFNAAGQDVYTQRISHLGGNATQTINLPSSVRPGIYNLMIAGDNYKESKMFVIQ